MKLKFDLSTIMQRAWSMFRNRWDLAETFADCLRKAWAMAKAYAMSGKASLTHGVAVVCAAPAMSYDDGVRREYASGSNGRRYFGD